MADDVVLGISARDRGARQLIRDLVNALLGLQGSLAKTSSSNREAAQAARQASNAIREQVKTLNEVRATREAFAARVQALGKQEVADAQRQTAAVVENAKKQADALVAAARVKKEAADQATAASKAAMQQEIANQNAIVRAVEQEVTRRIEQTKRIADSENVANQARELAAKHRLDNLTRTRDREREIGKQQIADAKKQFQDAQAAQKLTVAKTPERVAADAGVAAAKSRLDQIKEAVRVQDAANDKAVKQQQDILKNAQRFADAKASINKRIVADAEKAGAAEVAAAKRSAEQTIKATQDRVKAREAEARQAGKNVSTVIAAGKLEVAQAREKARQDVANARTSASANNARARAAIKASSDEIKAARASAVEQNRQAREFENAARRATQALQNQAKAIPGLSAGLSQLQRTVLQLVTAYGGFRALTGFVKTGIQFNQLIESSRLGIAALITAEADLTDQQGRQLQGLTALRAAQGLATDQLNKLRIAGIQTSATTEALVTAFQEAVGAGVAVGLTLDQIRQFSVSVAQAAAGINLPMSQLQQETRSILQGTIDRNSRIAKALNLTNAMVNKAKEEGRLFDLLNEKFKAFNIAGVESVKTFSALGSNISDAFQVLSGAAVEPLFIRLRDAGQDALKAIFDFKTADIQESFRGLVDAAKLIFNEIGLAFADAIRGAVRGATALSQWLRENREIVKQTAAAVGTMVREFGDMVLEIGRAIQRLTDLAGGTNTVINAARILQSIFRTIREDAALIAGYFAGRAAFGLLTNIGKLVIALKGIMTGAAVGSAVPGIGTAVGAVAGGLLSLHTIYNLIRGDQQRAREEAARTTTTLEDQARTLANLTAEYSDNARILKDSKLSDEEKLTVQRRLNEIRDKFIQAGGSYRDIFNQDKVSVDALAKSLRDLLVAQTDAATNREGIARDNLFVLQQQLQKAQQQLAASVRPGPLGLGTVFDKQAADRVKTLQNEVNVATADVQRLSDQTDVLTQALDRASQASVNIKAHTPEKPAGTGEDPRIAQARAEFERTKAELDLQRAQIQRDLAARRITQEKSLELLLLADLAELRAEGKFITAQKEEADRKIRVSKPGSEAQRKAQDEAKAFEIQLQTLGVKMQTMTEEFNAKIVDLMETRADTETQIRARALRAQGKELEAALLEIDRQTKAQLDKAEQDFREFSPEIQAQLKIAITHEQLEKAVKAVQEEINRIIQTRSEEERAAREEFARRGKLSLADRQALSDRIAKANQDAATAAAHAREVLEQLKVTAKDDPGLQTFIGRLLAELDTLTAKSQKVDLELQKLKEGARAALEGGLTEFFTSLGDATVSLAQSFKNMVTSILKDMQRLVSGMLAQKITSLIFGVASTAAGAATQAPGNTTQSGGFARGGQVQGRAEGGPGRPAHGVLRGGVSGMDSIPILAMPEEYFVRREAVRKYGVELFDLLNRMELPTPVSRDKNRFRFAQGGVVEGPSVGARSPQKQEVHHTIGVDSQGLLRVINGRVGQDAVVRASKLRRREIGKTLMPQRR